MNSNTDTTIQVDEVTPKDDLFETSIPEYGEYCSIKEKICNFGLFQFSMAYMRLTVTIVQSNFLLMTFGF